MHGWRYAGPMKRLYVTTELGDRLLCGLRDERSVLGRELIER